MSKGKGIALSEMIEHLREELSLSMAMGHGQAMRFEPLEVVVETQVTVSRGTKGEAGVKFWVVEAGGSAEASSSSVQKIVLKLRPRPPKGEDGEGLLSD